jgi:hypothetical protein
MKDIGIVRGSVEQAKNLIVGKDTVYVHTDIKQIFEDREGKPIDGLYEYHEIQYTKDEYIKLISEQNDKLEQELIDTQIAIVEIFESMEV